jgi:acyl dehydratase
MISFARQYDPQWFHVDKEAAGEGRWGGLIASGWLSCAIAMRLVVDNILHDSESFGSPGLEKLRWLRPVRPGDALSLHVTVDSKRTSSTRSDLGIVRWSWQLFNQNGEEVLDTEVTSMFDLGTGSA